MQIEEVCGSRVRAKGKTVEYSIRWKGAGNPRWYDFRELHKFYHVLLKYEEEQPDSLIPSSPDSSSSPSPEKNTAVTADKNPRQSLKMSIDRDQEDKWHGSRRKPNKQSKSIQKVVVIEDSGEEQQKKQKGKWEEEWPPREEQWPPKYLPPESESLPVQVPIQESVERPVEVAKAPVQIPVKKSVQKPVGMPVQKAGDKPVEKIDQRPAQTQVEVIKESLVSQTSSIKPIICVQTPHESCQAKQVPSTAPNHHHHQYLIDECFHMSSSSQLALPTNTHRLGQFTTQPTPPPQQILCITGLIHIADKILTFEALTLSGQLITITNKELRRRSPNVLIDYYEKQLVLDSV